MTHLFDSLAIRDITFANRVFVSPMCQYSSTDGYASDWHFVHLGSRAVGGAGLVLTEAAAVLPEGRISPQDLGIWMDDHIEPLARFVRFIHEQGSVAGMQLAHAGRKASTYAPWRGHGMIPKNKGGWNNVVAPSALAFADDYPMPRALSIDGIRNIVSAFAAAARRACEAGFRVIEIQAAHGYLIHEFLSPLSNRRTDSYGGSLENRTRMLREIVAAIRGSWPERAPLFVRISATDWIDGGWNIQQSVELARQLTGTWSRPDRLLFWRQCTACKGSRRSGLSNAICRADPAGGQHLDRRGRNDHISDSGRAHCRYRTGGRSHHRPRTSARSVLAIAGSP